MSIREVLEFPACVSVSSKKTATSPRGGSEKYAHRMLNYLGGLMNRAVYKGIRP
jgi:hypothetical protein